MSKNGSVEGIVRFVRDQFRTNDFIPLHEPRFTGSEREFVLETIDSSMVSSVGAFVDRFEAETARYTGSPRAVAAVNGTAALHIALKLAGVVQGDLVITQPLTFVATCNAIAYCHAEPVFVDVDRHTLGLSPRAMEAWLDEHGFLDDDGVCRTKVDGRPIRACVPMHTFGHPCEIARLAELCNAWGIALVEDAAESLGSLYQGKHTGTFGDLGVLSFNGNKIITTGGGGMILTDDVRGARAKHLTTTAKRPHSYEYYHDELGYNFRMPNINAALGCAQLMNLEHFIARKRELAGRYEEYFRGTSYEFIKEPQLCRSNYWLNAVACESREHRDELLQNANEAGVMTRPIWTLMNHLPLYEAARRGPLPNAEWLEQHIVNLPSSVPPGAF